MVSFYPKKNSLTPNVFSGICLQRVNVNKKPTYFELFFQYVNVYVGSAHLKDFAMCPCRMYTYFCLCILFA